MIFPTKFTSYPIYRRKVYAILTSEFFCWSNRNANLLNVFKAKLVHFMVFTSGSSVFNCPVFHILFMRAKKKVIWINAWWVVTLMANKKAFRYCSICYFPGYPMGSSSIALSVTSPITRTFPYPAKISFFNMLPETIFNWDWFMETRKTFFIPFADRLLAVIAWMKFSLSHDHIIEELIQCGQSL